MDDCLRGTALLDDIDDYIDRWHAGDTGLSLPDFLGLTAPEYNAYLLDDNALAFAVKARREQRPFAEVVRQDDHYALAARAQGGEKISQLLQWLTQQGLA